jgi:hypothetical protein
MVLIKKIKKYSGVFFFEFLYLLNLITIFSTEINRYLIFMTAICLLFPIIPKQILWK